MAARVDAFIVERNVHHPTDLSLLWDAPRAALRDTAAVARKAKLRGWRQVGHWQRQLRTAFNRVSRQRQWSTRPAAVKQYLRLSAELTHRIEQTVATLQAHATPLDPRYSRGVHDIRCHDNARGWLKHQL